MLIIKQNMESFPAQTQYFGIGCEINLNSEKTSK